MSDVQGQPERTEETQVANKVVESPLDAQRRAEESRDAYSERPHVFVGAAFLGGVVAAQLLKHLGGGDD